MTRTTLEGTWKPTQELRFNRDNVRIMLRSIGIFSKVFAMNLPQKK